MEIGPIFRALVNHRSRFWLITLEIALTLAIVTNCFNMIMEQRSSMIRPTGIAVEEIMILASEPWAEEFEDEDYREAAYEEDLRVLSAIPGVVSASAISNIPLSGGGSSTGRRIPGSDLDPQNTPYFIVSPGALQTLGLELIAGRDFEPGDFVDRDDDADPSMPHVPERHNAILTKALADQFYPDGDALGKEIRGSREDSDYEVIVGIVKQMHGSWPQSSVAEYVALFPGTPVGERQSFYLVRAKPGSFDEVFTTVDSKLLESNPGRIVSVESLDEVKADTYGFTTAMIQLLGGLSFMLILVTTLGIVGLTSFSVTQRSREIGTRRALGATKWAILRYFLVENWLMTTVGLTFGVLATFGLNFVLAQVADVPAMDFRFVLGGMLALLVTGQLAALLPALRGMTVAPVVATRNVY